MNNILKLSIASILIAMFASPAFGQSNSKSTYAVELEVSGVCKMCKKRIERAALIKGVKMAEWDKTTQKLKVIYKPDRVHEIAIHEAVAAAGHDTDQVKAPEKAYKKLPKCCRYRDGVEVH